MPKFINDKLTVYNKMIKKRFSKIISKEYAESLNRVKLNLLNIILVSLAIVVPIPVVISIIRSKNHDIALLGPLHLSLAIVIIVSAIIRKQLSYEIKYLIIMGVLVIVGIAGLYKFGLFGVGILTLMLFSIMTSLFYGKRAGIIANTFNILLVAVIGCLYVYGKRPVEFNINNYFYSLTAWLNLLTSFFLWPTIAIIAIGTIKKHIDYFLSDIQEKKEKLQKSEKHLRLAQEIGGIGSWELDHKAGRLFWSDQVYHIFDLSPQKFDATYEAFLDAIHPDDREFVDTAYRNSLETKELYDIEHRILLTDDRIKYVRERCETEFSDDGSPLISRGTVQDITEQKEHFAKEKLHKEQLQQADKLASLGQLVAGVAHEVNNPNNFIMLNSTLLSDTWRDIEPVLDKYYESNSEFELAGIPYEGMKKRIPKLFDGVVDGSDRIKKIVSDLKDFARKDNNTYNDVINVYNVINSAVTLLENYIKKATDNFRVVYGDKSICIKGNRQKLEQVLINLIQNACDALEKKDDALEVRVEELDNNCAISISDEGCGIAPEEMKQIFNPFYTKKLSGVGTGLGLSVSDGIVKEHGGTLEVSSEVGVGTTIKMNLPLCECMEKNAI